MMELYYDGTKIKDIELKPYHTISFIKSTIRDWLQPQGISYGIKLYLSDGTAIDDKVWTSPMYDGYNLYNDPAIKNSKIYIFPNIFPIGPAIPTAPASPTRLKGKLVEVKGKKGRKKVYTEQKYKDNPKPIKSNKAGAGKIREDEQEYIRAIRLQKFAADNPMMLNMAIPKRLQGLSPAELANLEDAPRTESFPDISEEFLTAHALPDKGGYVLRPHQITVVRHMLNHRGLIANHSVGSGKTLIAATTTIMVLRAFPDARVIFVGPKSLLSNYRSTLDKSYHVIDWDRISLYTYEKFRIDYSKGRINCYNKYLIVDEAHRLRTVNSSKGVTTPGKTTKAIMQCAKKSGKVLLLTATPVVNELYDIYPLIAILNGDLTLIPKSDYYKYVIDKKGTIKNINNFNRLFYGKISTYIRPEDATFPTVIEHTVRIPMSHDYYVEYARVESQNITDVQRKVLGPNDLEPFYNGIRRTVNADIEEYNPKLDWVRYHLLSYNNRKMIIFSPFISLGVKQLEQVVQDFDTKPIIGQITGQDTAKQRQEVIDKFNRDEIQVLLISIGAGGLGINLIGTRDVVIMQPGWNEVEKQQAMGRAVRFHSHTHLPKDEQQVDVWSLLLVKPDYVADYDKTKSADEIIVEINDRKTAVIEPFMNRLARISIENMA